MSEGSRDRLTRPRFSRRRIATVVVGVRTRSRVANSVILNGCVVNEGAVVENAVIDKRAIIGRDVRIGEGDPLPNTRHPGLMNDGLTVIGKEARLPKGLRVGRNCLIRPGAVEADFTQSEIPSGQCF